ncbi:aldo/keto reductase [Flammeovirga yaeyamensis]|uniref:Aldo/keto reductase n=1 Tax=Flammeovirga yaeyamensis TaxID=367791 RepID=A0AAX1N7P3_9BACT|nr:MULTISPECIES: aldo/keto reductase [Flammeovirga]ANQ48986.1 aldo/keto reductase [Flammeovirga sp. MY04]MBB3699070.1 diketogulonate reductase-like aldo/keto reductase [Flammeovirga yaeyamensis]NMF36504.1 aldo/keto reductase [Flammeovirga yaeyamensis]QWG03538.1 aldo/keto reductase [Flammeovirga yaeyamensis]
MISIKRRKFNIFDMNGTFTLRNTVKMPFLGMNISQISEGMPIYNATKRALQIGYRYFDCATRYNNMIGFGKAINESAIDRDQLFVSLKVGDEFHGFDNTINVFNETLRKAGLTYIDLLMIEHPLDESTEETWRALEQLYVERRVRAIGVCNFTITQLEQLIDHADVFPVANQIEFNPMVLDPEMMKYCENNGIQLISIGALKHGKVLELPEVVKIAEKYNVAPCQIALRWILQSGVVTLPQAEERDHLLRNSALFNIELSDEDMELLDGISNAELV